ncbi:MAG: cardiolipin synthase [Isosphaeraceae bacterium]
MPNALHFDYLLPLSEILTVLGFVLALLLLAHLLRSKRPPQSTIAWLLTIVLLPYLGVPLYLMLGGRKMRRLALRKQNIYSKDQGESVPRAGVGAESILRSFGVPAATASNRVRLITSGVEAYEELLRFIDGATRSIHVTLYLMSNDLVAQNVVARLARKAREGVDVRVLLDSVGSWRLRRSTMAPLEAAGGRFAFFMPVLHVPFRGRSNLRNHRKILVADGRVAMTGGMNVAAEYLGPLPDPRRWKDLLMVVEGPAVADLDEIFWWDWCFATAENPSSSPESPSRSLTSGSQREADLTPVQVVASGPDVEGDPLYESLITLLFSARSRIWVVTPYFVPDEILARALDMAARRGVDVRIMVPHRSNHRSADLARVGYLREIHQAGGKILRYRLGMLHAKAILIDDEVAVVGSANMDMRSLFLNYEVALFLYSHARIVEIEDWFTALSAHCRAGLSRPNWLRELTENVVRLLSPLL